MLQMVEIFISKVNALKSPIVQFDNWQSNAVLKLTCAKKRNEDITMHCLGVNTDNHCCYFKQYLLLALVFIL